MLAKNTVFKAGHMVTNGECTKLKKRTTPNPVQNRRKPLHKKNIIKQKGTLHYGLSSAVKVKNGIIAYRIWSI